MCCDYNLILIIFIILYNIIDIYNRHIKANKDKEDYKKQEEFKTNRKELINYIFKNYEKFNCYYNYDIIIDKINNLDEQLKNNNKSLNIEKLLIKIEKELRQMLKIWCYNSVIINNINKIRKDLIAKDALTNLNFCNNFLNIALIELKIGINLSVK
jgi:hypothetical protein